MKHILLSSMGAGGARDTEYYFEHAQNGSSSQTVTSGFSATALWQLLPEASRPDEIWFLLTPKAEEKAWSGIQEEAEKLGVKAYRLFLEGGSAANDTNLFLSRTAEELPPNTKLTLDITQGLRHHAFLFFALALYVSRFRKNDLEGVWYSRIETDDPEAPKPIIDLKPVLDLANWFLALSEFQDTGSLRAMSQLVDDKRVQKLFCQLSHDFLTGLPVEAGISANKLREILEKTDNFILSDIPLEKQVRELILADVTPLAGSFLKKSQCCLNEKELDRQAQFVNKYLESGQDNLAFGFMREWMVTQVLAREHVAESWLTLKQRERVEKRLGCLSNLLAQQEDPNRENLSEELKAQAQIWDHLGRIRNALQHHGMRPDGIPNKSALFLRKAWEERKTWSGLPVFGGGQGKLLVCPLGNTAGVLYSALLHTQPDRCLVLCSPQTEPAIQEVISKAGWEGEPRTLLMQDVHRGVQEFNDLLNQAKEWLFEADRIEANLTGGTSLMGVLVGRLLEHAGRTYRRPKRRFVLIDARPYEEQKSEPWVKGDIHYIDGESEQAGGEG